MLTRWDIPKLLTSGLKTIFFEHYKKVVQIFPIFTTEVPSTKATEEYDWLGSSPVLREWKDERMPKALLEHGFSLKNKDYEATIAVHKNALADDQYGQIKIRVAGMGTEAAKGYDRFAAQVVEAGHTTACYDGQNFFDTDHSEGESGTQSNYSSSGKAFGATSIKYIITTMMDYKTDNGEFAGVSATHVMVPTALKFDAMQLLDPQFVSVTTDPAVAVLKGALSVIVNPYLTSNGANSAYYVMDLSGAVKPFIYQNRQAMEWAALDKNDDPDVFSRKELMYWVDARFAFGYGDWRYAYKALG